MVKTQLEGRNYLYRSCPLCNGSSFKPYILQGGMDIVRCLNCSLVFKNPQPTVKFLSEQTDEVMGDETTIKDCNTLRNLIKKEILHNKTENFSVLDVNCCDGSLLTELHDEGVETYSIVQNRDLAEMLREETGLKTITTGNFEEVSFSRKEIDVILYRFSFERSFNPIDTLNVAHRLLKENGKIIIVTNNLKNRFLSRKNWRGFTLNNQLYYYTPSSLRAMLEKERFSFTKALAYPDIPSSNDLLSETNNFVANISGLGYFLVGVGIKKTINLKLTDLKAAESGVFVFGKPQATSKNIVQKRNKS